MMIRFLTLLLATFATTLSLTGCATAPQSPIEFSAPGANDKGGVVGVGMTQMPKVDTQFPGADCLLCIAFASAANSSLTKQVQSFPYEGLPSLKSDIAKLLAAKGYQVKVLDESIDVKSLPSLTSKEPNFARRDFTSLKAKYQVDRLLLIDITSVGVRRNYSAYIPAGDPTAIVAGSGSIINLSSNALEWYLPVTVTKGTEKWDEPPAFPGMTNAYFQAVELGKDAFTAPFKR
jgi:hypothetical protein